MKKTEQKYQAFVQILKEELLKTNAIYREVYESQVKGGEDHE